MFRPLRHADEGMFDVALYWLVGIATSTNRAVTAHQKREARRRIRRIDRERRIRARQNARIAKHRIGPSTLVEVPLPPKRAPFERTH